MEPCRRATLKNMARGILPWDLAITHRVKAADSAAFYPATNNDQVKDVAGAVFEWV
jgi:hypothetical protein